MNQYNTIVCVFSCIDEEHALAFFFSNNVNIDVIINEMLKAVYAEMSWEKRTGLLKQTTYSFG